MAQPRLESIHVEGERIVLRKIDVDDADAAFRMLYRRREVLDWLAWPGPENREQIAEHYAHWRRESDSGADYQLAIVERASGAFAGSIALRFAGHPFNGSLGYWIDSDRWGRGYASEAVRIATWIAFTELEAVLAYAHADAANHGSRRALEKNGFEEELVAMKELASGLRRVRHFGLSRTGFERAFAGWSPTRAEIEVERFESAR